VIERDAALPLFPTPGEAAIKQYSGMDGAVMGVSLLSLIHYFHAERLWQQSIAVIRWNCAHTYTGTTLHYMLSVFRVSHR
jgi:hypothetical protein